MTAAAQPASRRAPVHLWIIGVLALLWNGFGAFDYLMTETHNANYLATYTPEQLAYFDSFPAWAVALWAIAVWGGVLGSLLLLLRRRAAVPVFLASLVASILVAIQNFTMSNRPEALVDTFSLGLTASILLVGVGLYWYATRLRANGILV